MALGRPDEARPLFLEALGLRIHLHGDNHADTAIVLRNLSILAYSQGCYEEAQESCQSAIIAQRSVYGDRHESVAESLGHLAEIHRCLGRPEVARPLYEESIEMTAELLGPEHPRGALLLNNMAAMLYAQV